jgi:hypothetical protein
LLVSTPPFQGGLSARAWVGESFVHRIVAQGVTGREPNGRASSEILTSEGLNEVRSVLKGAKRRADKSHSEGGDVLRSWRPQGASVLIS